MRGPMQKRTTYVMLVACVGIASGVLFIWWIVREPSEVRAYNRIEVGMSVEEVEAILGAGTVINQAQVPSYVVAVNPDEEAAFFERHRKAGTIPTVRDYATRYKPFVEGDVIYLWKWGYYEIWLAFKDGKVCEKWFRDLNYL